MKTTCLTFYNNLREACRIYAEKSYKELKAITSHVKFSDSFLKKMKNLIKTVELRQSRKRNEKLRNHIVTVISRAAVIFFVTVALALTVSMSVEATRNSILKYLTEIFDDHIRIRSVNMDPYDTTPVDNGVAEAEEIDMLAVYVDRLVEMGFEVVKHENSGECVEYYKLNNNVVRVSLTKFSVEEYQVTTMHFDKTKPVYSSNNVFVYELEKGLGWYWESGSFLYKIVINSDYDTSLDIIRNVIN